MQGIVEVGRKLLGRDPNGGHQVRTPHVANEERVPRQDGCWCALVLLRVVHDEADALRSMSGRLEGHDAHAPHLDGVPVMQRMKRELGGCSRSQVDLRSDPLAEFQMPGEEVRVEVGQEDVGDADAEFGSVRDVLVDVALGIDDGGPARRHIRDQIGRVREAGQVVRLQDHVEAPWGRSLGARPEDAAEGPGPPPGSGSSAFPWLFTGIVCHLADRTTSRPAPPHRGRSMLWRPVRLTITYLALGCCLVLATPQGASPSFQDGTDPAVREGVTHAWKRLPEPVRALLAGLEIRPVPRIPPAPGAALAERLFAAGQMALFEPATRTLAVVASAAAPAWDGGAATPAELVPFLSGLADALEIAPPTGPDDAALRKAWLALAGEVATWTKTPFHPEELPVGDPAVLNALAREARHRGTGGPLDLEGAVLHELGRALLLLSPDGDRRATQFATLSGWTETETGRPISGMLRGQPVAEDALTFFRIILGGARGAGRYRVSESARFPAPLARLDPVQDFATCWRFLLLDPRTLARTAPEKLLVLDAGGWLTRPQSGSGLPPILGLEQLAGLAESAILSSGVARLLGREPGAPVPAAQPTLGALRAHATVLAPLLPPPPDPPLPEFPEDLPRSLLLSHTPESFRVTIEERRVGPATAPIMDVLDDALVAFASLATTTPRPAPGRRASDPPGLVEGVLRAAAFLDPEPHPAWKLALEVWQASVEGHAPEAATREIQAADLIDEMPTVLDRARAQDVLARAALRRGDVKSALARTRTIPGTTLGAAMRADILCLIAEEHRPRGSTEGRRLVEEAAAAGRGIPLPDLADEVVARVARAFLLTGHPGRALAATTLIGDRPHRDAAQAALRAAATQGRE